MFVHMHTHKHSYVTLTCRFSHCTICFVSLCLSSASLNSNLGKGFSTCPFKKSYHQLAQAANTFVCLANFMYSCGYIQMHIYTYMYMYTYTYTDTYVHADA